jgi:acylphosphatase
VINLTAHEGSSPLPCLCKGCFERAPTEASADGVEFRRVTARAAERELHAWVPRSLDAKVPMLVKSMEQRLAHRFVRQSSVPLDTTPLVDRAPALVEAKKPGLWSRFRKLFS